MNTFDRAIPEPNVIFAQKATAIVKAAGLDPRSIDLEMFRSMASVIFCKAYCAIYKENLVTEINELSSREELALNSQLVIDGLIAKTRNPALTKFSGSDIVDGNHKAIGILVGVLFAEGQRLWLQKLKSSSDLNQVEPLNLDKIEKTTTDDKNEQDLEKNMLDLEQLRANGNVSPRELDQLLNRITYLEDKLRRKKKNKKQHKHKLSPSRKSQSYRTKSEMVVSDEEHPESPKRKSQDEDNGHNNNNIDDDQGIIPDDHEGEDDGEDSNSEKIERHVRKHRVRKVRPSSAPSTRKVKEVSSRLYSAPMNRNLLDAAAAITAPQQPKVDKTWNNTNNNNNNNGPSLYTYDMRSGRRILLTQAEYEAEERRKQRELMGNVMGVDEYDDELMKGGVKRNNTNNSDIKKYEYTGIPVKAEWPGKNTSKSVEDYLKKVRKLRGEDEETHELPQPKQFSAYSKLDKLEMVISVEHCFNCEHHNISLRHKPEEYITNADSFLKILSQIVFENNIAIKLGVTRFKADITPKSKTTDEDSRIGAFEIQIACRTSSGELLTETLHSKLTSRKWPSKMVLEKRLKSFLSKTNASIYNLNNYQQDDLINENGEVIASERFTMATDSIEPYPVGACEFKDTPLGGDVPWVFIPRNKDKDSKDNATTATNNGDSNINNKVPPTCTVLPNVQWVFDTRSLSNLAKFPVGITVRVADIIYKHDSGVDCKERQCLLGVVKEIPEETNATSSKKRIIIKLKYHTEEMLLWEKQCMSLREYQPRNITYTPDELPIELETCLLLGKQDRLINWRMLDNEDTYEVALCRASFFKQIRKLVWDIELKHKKNSNNAIIKHPITNENIELQYCYSEEVLDWVFARFNSTNKASMPTLEMLANKAAEAKQAKIKEEFKSLADTIRKEEEERRKKEPKKRLGEYEEQERVEVNYKGRGKWFSCIIYRIHEESQSCDVRFDDGENENGVKIQNMRKIQVKTHTSSDKESDNSSQKVLFQVGDKVEVNYKNKDKWFPAKITSVHPNNFYDVYYDDGETENKVDVQLIRARPQVSRERENDDRINNNANNASTSQLSQQQQSQPQSASTSATPVVVPKITYIEDERVEMLYNETEGQWVECVITWVHNGGIYDVEFDDGDRESEIPASRLRKLGSGDNNNGNENDVGDKNTANVADSNNSNNNSENDNNKKSLAVNQDSSTNSNSNSAFSEPPSKNSPKSSPRPTTDSNVSDSTATNNNDNDNNEHVITPINSSTTATITNNEDSKPLERRKSFMDPIAESPQVQEGDEDEVAEINKSSTQQQQQQQSKEISHPIAHKPTPPSSSSHSHTTNHIGHAYSSDHVNPQIHQHHHNNNTVTSHGHSPTKSSSKSDIKMMHIHRIVATGLKPHDSTYDLHPFIIIELGEHKFQTKIQSNCIWEHVDFIIHVTDDLMTNKSLKIQAYNSENSIFHHIGEGQFSLKYYATLTNQNIEIAVELTDKDFNNVGKVIAYASLSTNNNNESSNHSHGGGVPRARSTESPAGHSHNHNTSTSHASSSSPNVMRNNSGLDSSRTAHSVTNELITSEHDRDGQNYQTKDLVFNSIVIEGEVLEHPSYLTAIVVMHIGMKTWNAEVCLAREKGSKRRSYNIKWPEITVTEKEFKENYAFFTLVITDLAISDENPLLPTLHNTTLGESANSLKVPLYKFMKTSYEWKAKLVVPSLTEGKDGVVILTIHGHAREARETRVNRIMSLRPADLVNIKFEPLPIDDGDEEGDEDDYSDDHEEEADQYNEKDLKSKSKSASKSTHNNKPNPLAGDDLASSLFPKASMNNLLSK